MRTSNEIEFSLNQNRLSIRFLIMVIILFSSLICFGEAHFISINPTDSTITFYNPTFEYYSIGFGVREIIHIDDEPINFLGTTDSIEGYYGYGMEYISHTFLLNRKSLYFLSGMSYVTCNHIIDFADSSYIYSAKSINVSDDWSYQYSDFYITDQKLNQLYILYNIRIDDYYPYPDLATIDTMITIPLPFNSPQAIFVSDDYIYITSSDFNREDSSYGQGKLWKLTLTGEVLDSVNIGMNPTDIIGFCGPDYRNELNVLCSGDDESYGSKIYFVCRHCLSITDSLIFRGQAHNLSYDGENGNVYAFCNDPDSIGIGKILIYNTEAHEIIADVTSDDYTLSGTNFGEPFYEQYFLNSILVPSIDTGIINRIQLDGSRISLITEHTATPGVTSITRYYDGNAIEENPPSPQTHEIIDAYPNPFNSSCRIDAPEKSTITIYNIQGQSITRLNGNTWSPSANVPSGIYTARVEYKAEVYETKIVYLK